MGGGLLLYLYFEQNLEGIIYICIFLLISGVYLLVLSRKNYLFMIMNIIILYSNYSILITNFLFTRSDTMYTQIITPYVTYQSFFILFFFNYLYLFIVPIKISPQLEINIFTCKEINKSSLYILLLLLIAIFFLGFEPPDVAGERGSPSPIYEYALILFILAFYFSAGNTKYIKIFFIILLAYSMQNFIFGGRIMGLQFMLAAFLMLYAHKFKLKIFILIMLAGFVFMSIIGTFRGNMLSPGGSLSDVYSSVENNLFALDTAYSSYYTSETFVYVADILPFGKKLSLFGDFILSIFLGSKTESVVPEITKHYIFHYGGGILPFYFSFYLGTLGIIIPIAILRIYFNIMNNLSINSTGLKKCISIYLVCNSFRWYLYSPTGLFRGVLLLTIVFVALNTLNEIRKKQITTEAA